MKENVRKYLEKHGFEAFTPKAVLFDMDGVLYDSMPNHAVAWHESMSRFGIAMTHADAYATEGQRGVDTIRQMVRQQQQRDISEEEAQVMYNEKTRIFHSMPEAPLMPGILELMEKIHRLKMTICVVTGSGQLPLIERLLRDFDKYLDRNRIVTAYDVKRGKPYADPYLMGLEKAGNLQPWEAIVVENAPLGVEASTAARIFTVCVNSGHMPTEIFREKGADVIFDKMTDLTERWTTIRKYMPNLPRENRWNANYCQLMHFIEENRRMPSKYRPKERPMLNWIKYNRKLIARDLLPADRLEKFALFEEQAKKLRRVNQYAYKKRE